MLSTSFLRLKKKHDLSLKTDVKHNEWQKKFLLQEEGEINYVRHKQGVITPVLLMVPDKFLLSDQHFLLIPYSFNNSSQLLKNTGPKWFFSLGDWIKLFLLKGKVIKYIMWHKVKRKIYCLSTAYVLQPCLSKHEDRNLNRWANILPCSSLWTPSSSCVSLVRKPCCQTVILFFTVSQQHVLFWWHIWHLRIVNWSEHTIKPVCWLHELHELHDNDWTIFMTNKHAYSPKLGMKDCKNSKISGMLSWEFFEQLLEKFNTDL